MEAARDLFDRGFTAFQSGDFREAVECYTRLIAEQPRSALAYRSRAQAYRAMNDRTSAIADYDMAIRLTPSNPQYRAERAAELLRQRQFDLAIEDCNLVGQLDPGRADIFGIRGRCHAEQGNSEAALADYHTAIQMDPDNAHVYYIQRAKLLCELGKQADSIEDARAALLIDPEYVPAYEAMAIAHHQLGQFAESAAAYGEGQKRDPRSLTSALGRGISLFQMQDWDGAIEAANQSLAMHPGLGSALELRGLCHQNRGEYEPALADFNQLLEIHPNRPMCYCLRGELMIKRGEYAKAIQDFLHAWKHGADKVMVLNQLGWLHATVPDDSLRDGARAIEFATQACEISGFRDGNTLDTLAAAYAEAGDFEKAILWQEQALDRSDEGRHADLQTRMALYRDKKAYRLPPV